MTDNRYIKNRNLWKKVYPRSGQKPQYQELVANQITYSVNLSNFQRDRSLFRILPDFGQYQITLPPTSSVWEDGKFLITTISPDLEYTFYFTSSFVNPPVVSLGIFGQTDINPNIVFPTASDIPYSGMAYPISSVKVYGIGSPSTNSVTFRLSAPYTGSIHYFAFDSAVAATITPNTNYWVTGSYQASGNKITASLTQPNCNVLASWNPITITSNADDIRVTITPYLVSGSGPIIIPSADAQYFYDYGPFFSKPTTVGSTTIYGSTSGSVVFHYIAVALSGSAIEEAFMYDFGFDLG